MTESAEAEFDKFAEDYNSATWASVAGGTKEYFAQARICWLANRLRERRFAVSRVMDFGCGTGTATPYLLGDLGAESVLGVDPSARSLEVARRDFGGRHATFASPADYHPDQSLDLVYSNGVFHHIPIADRAASVRYVYRSLRPGGIFALWENNTWNPMMWVAMKFGTIDRNAIPITPPNAKRLLLDGGFQVIQADFLFVLPGFLGPLCRLDERMTRWPVGAQYQILSIREP